VDMCQLHWLTYSSFCRKYYLEIRQLNGVCFPTSNNARSIYTQLDSTVTSQYRRLMQNSCSIVGRSLYIRAQVKQNQHGVSIRIVSTSDLISHYDNTRSSAIAEVPRDALC